MPDQQWVDGWPSVNRFIQINQKLVNSHRTLDQLLTYCQSSVERVSTEVLIEYQSSVNRGSIEG